VSKVQGAVSQDGFLGGEGYSGTVVGIKQEGSQSWSLDFSWRECMMRGGKE